MKKTEFFIIYFCSGLILCILYATQPLGPVFEHELGINQMQASLFTTSILVPLACVSIFYGYLFEKIIIKNILITAFFLLGISEIIFSFLHSYFWLLNIRGFQGLLVPAVLTGIMSYLSQISNEKDISKNMGIYVGMTVISGFLGRLLSGFFTDLFGWRFFFFIIGLLALMSAFLLFKFGSSFKAGFIKPKPNDIIYILKIKHNLFIFLMIFGIFFSFQAILNFIPFELTNLGGKFSGSKIGMIYSGYIIGVLVSFNIDKLIKLFKTPINTIIAGIIVFIIMIQFFRFDNFWIMFLAMLFFCLGNFTIHSMASGFINKMATSHRGIPNGLYVSFYYAGGALGSFIPGFIYAKWGWGYFLTLITVVSIMSLISVLVLNHAKS